MPLICLFESPPHLCVWVLFATQVDGFDIVTMNMALMDIHDLEPLAVSIKQVLRSGGW